MYRWRPTAAPFSARKTLLRRAQRALSFGILIASYFFEVPNLNAAAAAPHARLTQILFRSALILLVPGVLLVAFFAIHHARSHASAVGTAQVSSLQTNWQAGLDVSETVASGSRRIVFPYSVIPGGVRDAWELQAATAKDPVVAEHYSDFRIVRAHTLRLAVPTAMYVSYRRNNHVYWTRHRVTIPRGETLITDGENYARVRCGNRLSPTATLPVSLSEPPTEELENPVFVPPLLANLMPGDEFDFPLPNALVAPPALPDGPVTSSVPQVGFPPILPPGTTQPGATTGTPAPPVAAPEPSALKLLLSAAFLFAALWLVLRK